MAFSDGTGKFFGLTIGALKSGVSPYTGAPSDFYSLYNACTYTVDAGWGSLEPSPGNRSTGTVTAGITSGMLFCTTNFVWSGFSPAYPATRAQYQSFLQWLNTAFPKGSLILLTAELLNPSGTPSGNVATFVNNMGGGYNGNWLFMANMLTDFKTYCPNLRCGPLDYGILNNDNNWEGAKTTDFINQIQSVYSQTSSRFDFFSDEGDFYNTISASDLNTALNRIGSALNLPCVISQLDFMANGSSNANNIQSDDGAQLAEAQRIIPVLWQNPYMAGLIYFDPWGGFGTDYGGGVYNDDLYKSDSGYTTLFHRPALDWIINYIKGAGVAPNHFPGVLFPSGSPPPPPPPPSNQLTSGTYLTNEAVIISVPAMSNIIGDTTIHAGVDSGDAGWLQAIPVALPVAATLNSLGINVVNAVGQIVLGLYDASGDGGKPGKLLAETAAFAATVGANNQNVQSPVALPIGEYWLAFTPSDNACSFSSAAGNSQQYGVQVPFGPLPATWPSGPNPGNTTWNLTATVSPTANTLASGTYTAPAGTQIIVP